jgi:arabinofuranan 3-O-arabinosyltransferase
MPGTVGSRASSAVDGDDRTAYLTPINQSRGAWVEFTYPGPITVEAPTMSVRTDGRHSVPTRISVSVDGADPVGVELPPVDPGEGNERGATTEVPLGTGPLTGTTFRFTIDEIREADSSDWFGGGRTVLPVGITEIGLPAVAAPDPSALIDDDCRDDLVSVATRPVPVRLIGTVGDAAAGRTLRMEACDPSLELPVGRTLLSSGLGLETGVDVDLVALSSAAGGAAGDDTLAERPGPGPTPPSTEVERTGRIGWQVDVRDAEEPYWVVLGQSFGDGWSATTADGADLGPPTLVNGYANGWLVDPAVHGSDVTVQISWPPQRIVWIGLALSALGVLVCIALAVRAPRRRRLAVPPMRPEPAGLLRRDQAPRAAAVALGLAVPAGALAWMFGGPQVGAAVAVGTALALGVRWGPALVRFASIGLFAAAAAYIVVQQYRYGYQVDFNWVEWFERTHLWGIAAAMLLLVSVAADGPADPAASGAGAGTGPDPGAPLEPQVTDLT